MNLFPAGEQLLAAIMLFCIGFAVCVTSGRALRIGVVRASAVYLWHTIFCVAYAAYVLTYGGDAMAYYLAAIRNDASFALGTSAIKLLTHALAVTAGLSFLGCFLFFNIVGAVGLLFFDASLRHAVAGKSKVYGWLGTVFTFLPSVSFWSSAIGKDAVAFFCCTLALWSALDQKKRSVWILVALSLLLIVRPHMAAVLAVSLAVSTLFQQKVSAGRRLLGTGICGLLGAAVLPIALDYVGLDEGEVTEYIAERQSHNLSGGGGIDIAAMTLPEQLFAYLFRPLPYESFSVTSLLSSLENCVLLITILSGLFAVLRAKRSQVVKSSGHVFFWLFSFSSWIMLASTTANLGISVRQKWMFLPCLIYLSLLYVGQPKARQIIGQPNLTRQI